MGVEPRIWFFTPKMDGKNNGKPYFLMDDLGVPVFAANTHITRVIIIALAVLGHHFLIAWFTSFTIFMIEVYHHPKGTTFFFSGGGGGDFQGITNPNSAQFFLRKKIPPKIPYILHVASSFIPPKWVSFNDPCCLHPLKNIDNIACFT